MSEALERVLEAQQRIREHHKQLVALHAELAAAVRDAQADGMSLADIGKALDPPVSRQRVFQMLAAGDQS